jgi:hypothetical protein
MDKREGAKGIKAIKEMNRWCEVKLQKNNFFLQTKMF